MSTDGYYQAILFNLGAGVGFIYSNNKFPTKLLRDRKFCQNVYLLNHSTELQIPIVLYIP